MAADPFSELRDVKVHFPVDKQRFKPPRLLRAVDGVSLSIRRGTSVGIVGESGSGKTTLALAVMRLIDITDGSITLDGVEISRLSGAELRAQRRNIQMVFQGSVFIANPRARARDIVAEPLEHMAIGSRAERTEMVAALFRQVGLRADQMNLFPHQFSGGQRQRIGIARRLRRSQVSSSAMSRCRRSISRSRRKSSTCLPICSENTGSPIFSFRTISPSSSIRADEACRDESRQIVNVPVYQLFVDPVRGPCFYLGLGCRREREQAKRRSMRRRVSEVIHRARSSCRTDVVSPRVAPTQRRFAAARCRCCEKCRTGTPSHAILSRTRGHTPSPRETLANNRDADDDDLSGQENPDDESEPATGDACRGA